MSGKKRPAVGRRELQALGGCGESFLLDASPTKGYSVSQSAQDRGKNAGKELFGDHRRQTRAAVRRRRENYLRVHFNLRFRSLPAEVKDMIFYFAIDWDCKKTPALVIGLRARSTDQDVELYRAAWRAFCIKNTFVLTRHNSQLVNQYVKGSMPRQAWQTIRSLTIKHDYMAIDRHGFYIPFYHNSDQTLYCKYSPCTMCDYSAISLATNVRDLHLDFGNSYHCVMPAIECTCRSAVEEMQLERLVVTVSNIWRWPSAGFLAEFVSRVSYATDETGRLLSVSTKAVSAGPYTADFATESWFWNISKDRKRLAWVDDWEKKRARNEAEMERLYGPHARKNNGVIVASAAEDDDDADYEDNGVDGDGVDYDNADNEGAADGAADGYDVNEVIEGEGAEDEGLEGVLDEGGDGDGADDEVPDIGAADIANEATNTEDTGHGNSLLDDFSDISEPDESLFPDFIPSPDSLFLG